jgi:protein translocase SEC61 complex gamma subunit
MKTKNVKKLVEELMEVWRVARKPSWEETKQMVTVTLLISSIVGVVGLVIFLLIQSIL